jgi:hypothetical protein
MTNLILLVLLTWAQLSYLIKIGACVFLGHAWTCAHL